MQQPVVSAHYTIVLAPILQFWHFYHPTLIVHPSDVYNFFLHIFTSSSTK